MRESNQDKAIAVVDTALPDMQLALQGLQNAVQAMQEEIASQTSSLEQLQAHRRQVLENQVARLLPDFSGATLDTLTQACPGFVDDMVRGIFSDNRKILGLFTRPGAATALTTLRIRLAFFLDTRKGGDLRSLDEQITLASEAKQKLEKLYYETRAGIQTLEKYQASGQPLPMELQVYIRQLAERARQISRRGGGPQIENASPEYDNNYHTSYDNNAYPWLYFSHDIGQIGQDYSNTPVSSGTEVSKHKTETMPATEACPPGSQEIAENLACRTDDSLGAYS
ncbi:hypothetical protein ACO0LF_19100 [Undibacterium sp. Di27W]|uniref:hypothetical protein n=1 Tax=Undibacterium sp. Di27W TaxID=3413036 RepID=UPI003BF0FCB4